MKKLLRLGSKDKLKKKKDPVFIPSANHVLAIACLFLSLTTEFRSNRTCIHMLFGNFNVCHS